jgi:hypothetical protein
MYAVRFAILVWCRLTRRGHFHTKVWGGAFILMEVAKMKEMFFFSQIFADCFADFRR